ncbi:hypothetical protein AAG570_009873 [Ranatra chinensis]|uniref:Uncharacterized protein n=1 Tax=Ranatra chinensis TaxID=642074 RepID=A0ABD0YQD0_9HEMI
MGSKRPNMFYENKKQDTTEIDDTVSLEERERMRIESRKRNWKTSYNCINAPIESIKLEDDREFIFGQMYLTESASKFNDSLLPKKKEPPQVEQMFRPAPEYLETFIDPELPLPIGYKKAVMEWDKVQTRGLARNNERYWSHYRSK